MFTVKKIVASLVLPPGIFILLIGIVGLVLIHNRRWRTGMINLAVGLALWALSTVPVANWLLQGLEADFALPENPPGDVIILLGGGIIPGVPDLSGEAAPASTTMGRIVAAARLYRSLRLPIIVTGGRVYGDEDVAESSVARRFLVDLGVPDDQIIEENRARDTAQNARLTAAICRQRGFSRPILLTAAFHLKRARMAFDAAGLPVTAFPAYFLAARQVAYSPRHLLPSASALHDSAIALHEILGIWYYRWIEL